MLVWEPRSDGIGSSVPIRSVTSPSAVHSSTFPLRKTTRSALATPAGASRPLVSADQVRGIAVSSWFRNSNHTSFVSASLMRAPARRSLGGLASQLGNPEHTAMRRAPRGARPA